MISSVIRVDVQKKFTLAAAICGKGEDLGLYNNVLLYAAF